MFDEALSLKALIFDLDGTLANSRLDFAAMRDELSAPDDVGLLEYIDTLSTVEARSAAMSIVERHELLGAQGATWIPTAEAVIQTLHRWQVPIGIVTRNSRKVAQLTMQRLGIPDIPLRAREDAAPKPNPEALLELAETWCLAPQACAYVGDFRYDVEAAQRAGMQPILFTANPAGQHPYGSDVKVISDFASLLSWVNDARIAGDAP